MTNNNTHHIFTGTNALFDYLTPGSCGPLPLVELPQSLNPFMKDKVRIFVKLMNQLPLTNIKSIPSWNMLDSLSEQNKPRHLVEYSSGNTALSLTILAQYFGIATTHALIAPDVPTHKQNLLRLVGTYLTITDGPASPGVHDTSGGIWNATQLGKKKGWHNFNQYTNPHNPEASARYIAAEIWNQLGNQLSVFVSSIGTSGTLYGISTFLKRKKPSTCIIGTSIKTGSSIPGPRGEVAVKKLAFPWRESIDHEIPISTKPAYALALKLIRLGLFVGPSTGMQLAAIHNYINSCKKQNTLESLRNDQGDIVIVFLACDSMYPYIDEFFKVLPEKHFPKITQLLP